MKSKSKYGIFYSRRSANLKAKLANQIMISRYLSCTTSLTSKALLFGSLFVIGTSKMSFVLAFIKHFIFNPKFDIKTFP